MTNYPTSLDDTSSLPDPNSNNAPNNPSHGALHVSENAAIRALEAKLGTGNYTPGVAGQILTSLGGGQSQWQPPASHYANSPLTTKGDLWAYSTGDTRLPVGADGYILQADSTQAAGLKWVPAPNSAVWGSITGTLSNQTDLQTALNAKAAKGANSDITSLSGLSTPLSIAQGGTGSATQNFIDLTTDQSKNAKLELGATTGPTHSLTIASAGTGIASYNTADQITNYERAVFNWSANVFNIQTAAGGTGVARNIFIGDSGGGLTFAPAASSGSPKFAYNRTSGTSGSLFQITSAGGLTASSGLQYGLKIDPTINQSGTAASTMLLINPSVTAAGSGAQLLIDAQVGGSSKFKVDSTGAVTTAGPVTLPADPSSTLQAATKQYVDYEPYATGGRIIYDKSYWSSLSDFNVNGTSPTITNGSLVMNPGVLDSFDQNIELANIVTTDEQIDFEVTIKVVSISATAGGIAIGRRALNTSYASDFSAQLDFNTANNVLNLWQQASGAPGTSLKSKYASPGLVSANDIIRLTYSQRINTVTLVVNNITKHKIDTITATNNMGPTKDFQIPAMSRFRIFAFSGSFAIEQIRLISRQPAHPNVVLIGDSKTFGYSSTSIDMRWPSLLKTLGPVATFGGDADRTVEAVQGISYITAMKPKYAIMCIGRNDLATGVLTATWQANYSSMVSSLKSAGVTVIHLLPIPETSLADQSALTNYINSNYSSDTRIDVSGSWVNGTHLSSDGIHPNIDGHRLIASLIIGNGAISATASQVSTDVAPYMFESASIPALTDSNSGGWITPTLGTGWTNFDAGGAGNFGFPQYMKDSMGFVHLRGLAKNNSGGTNNGSTNATIFTLPAGFRPYQTYITVTDASDAFARVDVGSTGTVSLSGAAVGEPVPNNGWISLNGVIFLAEN